MLGGSHDHDHGFHWPCSVDPVSAHYEVHASRVRGVHTQNLDWLKVIGEEAELLLLALEQLLELRFEKGLTLRQTAEALRIDDFRTVHERLVRILGELRDRLFAHGLR